MSGSFDDTVRLWNDNGECVTNWAVARDAHCMTQWSDMLCTGHGDIINLWKDPNQLHQTLTAGSDVRQLVVCGDYLFSGTVVD